MTDQRRVLQRVVGPVWRRLRLLVSRGVLALVDDAVKLQRVQVTMLGDAPAWAERFQQYGYTSHPLAGAEAIVAAISGARAHLVALSVDDRRYRPTGMDAGEVCMYTYEGDEIRMMNGRVIRVTCGAKVEVNAPEVVVNASTSVTLNTPMVHAAGDIKADGEISDGVGSMNGMRGIFNGHDHPENDAGGPTGTPNQRME